jgi:hypothetical protein
MYGESKITTNAPATAPVNFATGQITGALGNGLRFSVEEEEMFTTIAFKGSVGHSVAEAVFDATLFVDGVDVGYLVDGLLRLTGSTVAASPLALHMERTLRLAPGEHKMEVRFKTAAGNVVVNGLLHPAVLSATRTSVPATNAANMTSKQVTGVY